MHSFADSETGKDIVYAFSLRIRRLLGGMAPLPSLHGYAPGRYPAALEFDNIKMHKIVVNCVTICSFCESYFYETRLT